MTSPRGARTPRTAQRGRTAAAAAPPAGANGAHPDARVNGRRAAGSHRDDQSQTLNGGRVAAGSRSRSSAARPTPATTRAPKQPATAKTAVNPKRAPTPARTSVPEPPTAVAPLSGRPPDVWDDRVADALAFLRRRLTGQYEVDEFGFDPELTDSLVYPLLRLLYRYYFRVECTGVENLPKDRSALVVANHSGTIPIDALMLTIAVHDETPLHRHLRLLAADLVLRVPVLSEFARKTGSTLACNTDAERLLRNGEYVGVFPEGFKGIGKPYKDRYKLQRFGRGGFVSAALRTGAPIVPVSIIGAEEIYPIVGNFKPLAKIAGLPYLPITPLFPWLGPLGMLPLPSKWLIEFGEPIETTPYADEVDDPIVVFNLADQVRETIQHAIHGLLEKRPDPFG